jgi:hypothetical protein
METNKINNKSMYRLFGKSVKRMIVLLAFIPSVSCFSQKTYTLKNKNLQISITSKGEITSLLNLETGQNYAGGYPIWRLYFDTKSEKENEVLAMDNLPVIEQDNNSISIKYKSLKMKNKQINMGLQLKIILENDKVRFCSKITNNEPHTIIRELHYPLLGNCQLLKDHQLLTASVFGKLYPEPMKTISSAGYHGYMAPDQYYRQMDLYYPVGCSANCFVFPGEKQGLYIGSHDTSFQTTGHGLRLYPNDKGEFDLLEVGLYKYPNCFSGESWECDANILAPYNGNWHQASKIYRTWVNTWWERKEPPQWVKEMKSWQRVIFRHQYGETLYRYSDLNNRIRKAGNSVGCDAVLTFGWWNAGMDNGYPDYGTDPDQGGDEAWKKAIEDYKKSDGKILLYFNGKLIDKESDYYKNGEGKEVCYRDNTGSEYNEAYKFRGMGSFTGYYNSRSFVVADLRNPKWHKVLLRYADIAFDFGANSVFYDQLGYAESSTNWDLSREFPVPNLRVIADKYNTLKMIHEYINKKDPEFALGTEHFTDVTAQAADYIHIVGTPYNPNQFVDWTRYTFPEVIISDREIYDDTDVERRVNLTVLKGLRNDIDVFRCRGLIDQTPIYQQYLASANEIKDKYKDLLLLGTYQDTEGFSTDNNKIDARCFTNGNKMAIVMTQNKSVSESVLVSVPGYKYKESSTIGNATIAQNRHITLGMNSLAVLIFEKD